MLLTGGDFVNGNKKNGIGRKSAMQKRRERTKKLTLGAVMCALGVVLLYLGSVVEVLDLSMAAVASLLCVIVVIEAGGAYPWIVYVVTSVLSVILLPQKTPALFYTVFAGYYPILKEKFERLSRGISYGLKFAVFNIAAVITVVIDFLLLAPQAFPGVPLIIGGAVVLNAVFALYDFALTRLISAYIFRFRSKFKFFK